MSRLEIGARRLGDAEPTYFIADISSNHDGDLERAKSLVHLAAEAGAELILPLEEIAPTLSRIRQAVAR